MREIKRKMLIEKEEEIAKFSSELVRKGIHLLSLSIPITYCFVTKTFALYVLIPMLFFALFVDVMRYYNNSVAKLFYKIFGFLLRKHEVERRKKNLNGATYLLISVVILVAFFPKVFVILSFSVLIVGVIFAALLGFKFGRHKLWAKSLEGTLAFLASSIVVVFLTPKVTGEPLEYIISIIAVIVGAIVENVSYGWADDNLTIPISIASVLWVLYSLFFTSVELVVSNSSIKYF